MHVHGKRKKLHPSVNNFCATKKWHEKERDETEGTQFEIPLIYFHAVVTENCLNHRYKKIIVWRKFEGLNNDMSQPNENDELERNLVLLKTSTNYKRL